MMRKRAVLRSLAAVLAGYAAIVLSTSAAFTPFGGVVHLSAPRETHLLATAIAIACGLLGGAVAAWLGGRRPVRHALGTAALVALESTVLLGFGERSDPLWFDLLGAVTLLAATIAGGYLWDRVARSRADPIRDRAEL